MSDQKKHRILLQSTLFFLVSASCHIYAKFDIFPEGSAAGSIEQDPATPWFTGPLIAPSPQVIPVGHANIEPYYLDTIITGVYAPNWQNIRVPSFYRKTLQVPVQVGIVKGADIEIIPQYIWNYTQGVSDNGIGDMTATLEIQAVPDIKDSWIPTVKFALTSNVPLGKYKRLSETKRKTDLIGSGSWFPGASLVLSKLIRLGQTKNFMDVRLWVNYSIGTRVPVRGINSYGGDPTTKGIVYPGNFVACDLAFEINITQNWAFAMDTYYNHINKDRFSGRTLFPSTFPSSEELSFAPALEYNWSQNIGVIGGIWFTAKGRNTFNFTTGLIALNIYI